MMWVAMGKAMAATKVAKAVTATVEAADAVERAVVKAVAVRGVARAALEGQWWSTVVVRSGGEGHKEVGGSEGDREGSGGDGGSEGGGKIRGSTSAILSMRHSHGLCGCAQTTGEICQRVICCPF